MASNFRKMVLIPADQIIQTGDGRSRAEKDVAATDPAVSTAAAVQELLSHAKMKDAKKQVFEEPSLNTAAQLGMLMSKLASGKSVGKMNAAEKMRMLRVAREMYNNMLDATTAHRKQLLQSAVATDEAPIPAPTPTPAPSLEPAAAAASTAPPATSTKRNVFASLLDNLSTIVEEPPLSSSSSTPQPALDTMMTPSPASSASSSSSSGTRTRSGRKYRNGIREIRNKTVGKRLFQSDALVPHYTATNAVTSTPQSGKGKKCKLNVCNASVMKKYCIYKY